MEQGAFFLPEGAECFEKYTSWGSEHCSLPQEPEQVMKISIKSLFIILSQENLYSVLFALRSSKYAIIENLSETDLISYR